MPFKKGQPPAPRKNVAVAHQRVESIIVKRARAANFIADMAAGMSRADVAVKYQVSVETVKASLRFAERENFFQKAEDAILHRLVPKAIDAYERALDKAVEAGDYDAAEKLLKGVRLFAAGGPARDQVAEKDDDSSDDELTWERFTAKRTPASHAPAHSHSAPERSLPGATQELPTKDAEIVLSPSDEASLHGSQPAEPTRVETSPGADGAVHAGPLESGSGA